MYLLFKYLRRLWVRVGAPCPRFVRQIRHKWFGKWWPVKDTVSPSQGDQDKTYMRASKKDSTLQKSNIESHSMPWRRILFQPKTSAIKRNIDQRIDIIIPTHNNAEYTIRCIESIKRFTSHYRIIWIDNGSAPNQIAPVEDALRDIPHIALKHPKRLGYVKATNMGIAASSSEIIVLLNNDTEVTAGWLETLLAPFDIDPSIGIVGPVTDAKGSWQGNVERECGYRIISKMVAFFCTAVHQEVVRQIGYLSEEYGEGFADDDDYCARARKAGWKIALAKDAFVRHAHRTTFRSIHGEEKVDMMVKEAFTLFKSKNL